MKDTTEKHALLLHCAGEKVEDIFDNLVDTGSDADYDKATTALTAYFQPKKCIEYQTYVFRAATQGKDETLDNYLIRLRELAKSCDFHDIDREIKAQIVQSCSSTRLRRRALRDDMTLKQLIDAGRAIELSDRQARTIEQTRKPESRGTGNGSRPGDGPTTQVCQAKTESVIANERTIQ